MESYERERSEARGRAKLGRRFHSIWIALGGAGLVAAVTAWLLNHPKGP